MRATRTSMDRAGGRMWGLCRRVARGFTMIELLVVVAIIAVLMGILLPALRGAREASRLAQCMSNAKQVTIGGMLYAYDQRDGMWPVIPAWVVGDNVEFDSWKYGGKTADNFWIRAYGGQLRYPVQTRKINSYVVPDMQLRDTGQDDRLQLPVFACPSDSGTFQRLNWRRRDATFVRNTTISSYDDVGTSYHMNMKWFRVVIDESTLYPPPSGGTRSKLQMWEASRFHFRNSSLSSPARFVWMHDQTLDVAAVAGISLNGDHGGLNRATAAFMDGHVAYLLAKPLFFESTDYTLKLGRTFAPPGAPIPDGIYH